MKKIVISEFMDEAAVDTLRQRFQVRYDATLVDHPERLAADLADAHALIVRNRTQVSAELLQIAAHLSVVGRLGVGLDNIDMSACAARNVAVFPATGANAQAVAEYVIAATLMLLRGVYLRSADVAAGEWPRQVLSNGREAAGSVLAVIGFGGIGQLVARLARGLGITVVGYDPQQPADAPCWHETGARCMALDEALAAADAVTLHVPLTDATRNLLDTTRIGLLKPGAIVINTARGGTIDESALAAALQEKRLAGAALDVFADEPLRAGSPLAAAPNLILTPHIAGLTVQSNERVSSLVAARVAAALTE
ncbi:(S)-sulfolactate dehydrogenase [Caballeronia sp. SBC1]|uniref:NAD(P)-dependent oxidoreductase n=1 Tax=unclassified Caballeronia TaxID=2646786 RepID=UPI0013E1B6DF|nr:MULTISPECIES: NAD(P)-dependent oxidoreductase [unclassified Caballeronia]QIE23730.1 (S)-sulfolactate dehydrogenase [Caballeronia sp. SBC2]QIN61629.1 (S)-sulfolactate dehydrogenase [Caballeronia sp. SBC1]